MKRYVRPHVTVPENDRLGLLACPDCGSDCTVVFSMFTSDGHIVHLARCGYSCKDRGTIRHFTRLPIPVRVANLHAPRAPRDNS